MPSQIGRVPKGLLSLLDIQSLGQNPNVLPAELVSMVDTTWLYANDGQQIYASTGSYSTDTVVSFGGPPAGRMLYYTGLSLRILTGPAEAASAALAWFADPASPMYLTDFVTIGASTSAVLVLPRPILVNPGEQLGFVTQGTVGTIATAYAFRYKVIRY